MACKTHWESCKGANTLDATHVQLGYDEVQEPALRRPQTGLGKWTAEEDAELRALVRNDGPGGWQKKSQNFSTARSASSMSHRWVTLHPKPKEDRPASNVVSSPPSIRTDVGGLVDQSHGMCAGCIVPACAHTCGRAPQELGGSDGRGWRARAAGTDGSRLAPLAAHSPSFHRQRYRQRHRHCQRHRQHRGDLSARCHRCTSSAVATPSDATYRYWR